MCHNIKIINFTFVLRKKSSLVPQWASSKSLWPPYNDVINRPKLIKPHFATQNITNTWIHHSAEMTSWFSWLQGMWNCHPVSHSLDNHFTRPPIIISSFFGVKSHLNIRVFTKTSPSLQIVLILSFWNYWKVQKFQMSTSVRVLFTTGNVHNDFLNDQKSING